MIKRMLFATDFSRWARRAEDYSCALACSWKASLTVLCVAEFPPGLNPEYLVNQQYLPTCLNVPRRSSSILKVVQIALRVREIGVTKADMPVLTMFALAVLAGAFIALGAVFFTVTMTGGKTGQLPAFGLMRVAGASRLVWGSFSWWWVERTLYRQ